MENQEPNTDETEKEKTGAEREATEESGLLNTETANVDDSRRAEREAREESGQLNTEAANVDENGAPAAEREAREESGLLNAETANVDCSSDAVASLTDINLVPGFVACPPGLECLLDTGQLIIHQDNLRVDQKLNEGALKRFEVEDTTRRILMFIEQLPPEEQYDEPDAFKFIVYSRLKQEVMRVYCPTHRVYLCLGASWHCCTQCCHLQALVYAPPGVVAGFVRRAQSCFVQDFEVLDAQENSVLCLRGALNDMELYSADCSEELGRLSKRGWVGTMHELRRSRKDWGLTFPLDLDVRVKACLLGAVLVADYLNTKAGR